MVSDMGKLVPSRSSWERKASQGSPTGAQRTAGTVRFQVSAQGRGAGARHCPDRVRNLGRQGMGRTLRPECWEEESWSKNRERPGEQEAEERGLQACACDSLTSSWRLTGVRVWGNYRQLLKDLRKEQAELNPQSSQGPEIVWVPISQAAKPDNKQGEYLEGSDLGGGQTQSLTNEFRSLLTRLKRTKLFPKNLLHSRVNLMSI